MVKRYPVYHEHGTRLEVLYLIHCDTLLQNTTGIITKCDNYFITKCDIYYKMGRLFQIATVQLLTLVL